MRRSSNRHTGRMLQGVLGSQRHVLGCFDDVLDADRLGRTREQVAAPRAAHRLDEPGAPEAQQNLLDIVVRKALLPGQLAGRDRTLSRALS